MELFIHENAKLAVKHGIDWLDENHPGWVNKIDLNTLYMSDCGNCVIGQAVGEYRTSIDKASGTSYAGFGTNKEATIWAVEHGFESPRVSYYEERSEAPGAYGFDELDALWAEEVTKRLG